MWKNDMNSSTQNSSNEEWLKVLSKGLVTIPKAWREELGIKSGGNVKASKVGNTVVLEPVIEYAPIRHYTDKQVEEFLREDEKQRKQIDKTLAKTKKG